MSDDSEPELQRLRATGDPREQRLLASAQGDGAAEEARDAVFQMVLARHRADRRRAVGRSAALGAGLLAIAAGVIVYQRRESPPLTVHAETPGSALAPVGAPRASDRGSRLDGAFAACTSPVIAAGNEPLIDDFEDGDSRVPMHEYRAGNWYVFNDGTSSQIPKMGSPVIPRPVSGGAQGSHFALFTSGGKFTKWGAVMSFELSPRRCYDASVYAGVEFLARGRGEVWLNLKMTQVVPEEFGGTCKQDCYDSHQKLIRLAPNFQTYQIRWEELHQAGFGPELPFDPHSLYSIEFSVHPEQSPFGFWIDDLSFIKR